MGARRGHLRRRQPPPLRERRAAPDRRLFRADQPQRLAAADRQRVGVQLRVAGQRGRGSRVGRGARRGGDRRRAPDPPRGLRVGASRLLAARRGERRDGDRLVGPGQPGDDQPARRRDAPVRLRRRARRPHSPRRGQPDGRRLVPPLRPDRPAAGGPRDGRHGHEHPPRGHLPARRGGKPGQRRAGQFRLHRHEPRQHAHPGADRRGPGPRHSGVGHDRRCGRGGFARLRHGGADAAVARQPDQQRQFPLRPGGAARGGADEPPGDLGRRRPRPPRRGALPPVGQHRLRRHGRLRLQPA